MADAHRPRFVHRHLGRAETHGPDDPSRIDVMSWVDVAEVKPKPDARIDMPSTAVMRPVAGQDARPAPMMRVRGAAIQDAVPTAILAFAAAEPLGACREGPNTEQKQSCNTDCLQEGCH